MVSVVSVFRTPRSQRSARRNPVRGLLRKPCHNCVPEKRAPHPRDQKQIYDRERREAGHLSSPTSVDPGDVALSAQKKEEEDERDL